MKTKFITSNSSVSLASFAGFQNGNDPVTRLSPDDEHNNDKPGVRVEYNRREDVDKGPSFFERAFQ